MNQHQIEKEVKDLLFEISALNAKWVLIKQILRKFYEPFDHIESIEEENKELKNKLDESYVKYTKETSRLEQRNRNLEAKLSDIESNKVAEFNATAITDKGVHIDEKLIIDIDYIQNNETIMYEIYEDWCSKFNECICTLHESQSYCECDGKYGEISSVTISKDKQ